MELINEAIEKSVQHIREKAEEAISNAVQQAANARQILTRQGAEKHLLDQIHDAQASVHTLVEKIAAVKEKIAAERRPIHEKLTEMQAAVARARANVDNIRAQIKAKEKEIDRLARETHLVKNVWPLGKIRIPNPASVARAGSLRTEVAGLHGAMASAQEVLAREIHEMEALHVEAVNTPVEADPRVIALHKELEAEKTAIAALTGKTMDATLDKMQKLFTAENRHKLAEMASKQIDTGLPDAVEEALFFDAIAKIEQTVMEALPGKALSLIQDAGQGISEGIKTFESRLTAKVAAQVDIPMLDAQQEKVLFGMLIHVLLEAMRPEKTLDLLLAEKSNAAG